MLNSLAVFSTFTTAFDDILLFSGDPIFDAEVATSSPFIRSLFTFVTGDVPPGTPIIFLAAPNLSETISSLFANLTLGLVPYNTAVTTVNATTSTNTSVWEYEPWKLWIVYGSALLFGLPMAMYGLYCIRLSNAGVDDKFSDYLLATRGDDLREVCKSAVDFKGLQRVRLLYQKEHVFTVESGVKAPGGL